MDLHMQSIHWTGRSADWSAASVAGLVAGAVLMVLDLCWPLLLGDGNPWAASHKVAALALGPQALQSTGFDLSVVVVALLIHYTLGIFSGLVIGTVIAGLAYEGKPWMVLATGAVFGVVVYWVNFYLLASLFVWFQDMRDWYTLLGHVVFGVCAALVYRKLSGPSAS